MKRFCHRHHRAGKAAMVLALLAATVGFTGCRHGGPGGFGHGFGGGDPEAHAERMVDRISSELDLTAEQKASLEALKKDMLADFKNERSSRLAMADEIEKQLTAPQLDQAKLKGLMNEHHARMQAKMDLWLGKIAAFHATLTPEQKQKLATHFKTMRERFEDK